MNWLNPLAFLGLLALGIPILIHLFGRRVARRVKFPSLRLMGEAVPTAATRTVPSDLLLLIVRGAVVLAAVLALAQPLFLTAGRVREANRPVRVILVDTSETMRRRLTSNGTALVDVARERAQALLDSARNGTIIEVAHPGSNMAGAASWLEPHTGVREVVVVSDFQYGTLHDGQVAAIPAGVGLRLDRLAWTERGTAPPVPVPVDSLSADSSGTYASWRMARVDSLAVPVLLGSADELARLDAGFAAIRTVFGRPLRPTVRVAVVFPGYPSRAGMLAASAPLDSPWHGNLLLSLRRDRAFAEIMRTAVASRECTLPGTVVATNDGGAPVVSMNRGRPDQHDVQVFTCVEAASLAATGLLAALATGLDSVPPLTEREPLPLPDDLLQRWQREPVLSAPGGRDETSPDGRWLWLAALALLGVEEWLRRRRTLRLAKVESGEVHVRVA
jgi:hypothetical protein